MGEMQKKCKSKVFYSICCLVMALLMAGLTVLTEAPLSVQAADTFVNEYSDMDGQGGYIYYIRSSESGTASSIWRIKISTGKKSQVVAEKNMILDMRVFTTHVYYTVANEDNVWEIRSCKLNGSEKEAICEGRVTDVDDTGVYGTRTYEDGTSDFFHISNESGEERIIKSMNAKQSMEYVCGIEGESYYYLYDGGKDKLFIYRYDLTDEKLLRIATEKRVVKDSYGALVLSDADVLNGELYYNFGSYEGSGNFWNGTIRKITSAGKKKTIAKNTSEEKIVAGKKELYFRSSTGNDYKYNLKTGQKTKYALEFQADVSYTIMGDKTYMADVSNKKKIVISRFNSGTKRETLTRNFITIPFTQKKNVSYAVDIKKVGIYNMVVVIGTDFTNMDYGWRGKRVSVNWYVTDGAGTVLASFK
ncbi:MAG: DUF5050 domain-containing protein [Ruminococcus sp.]|nr:DUF5050 domain-containing protein [Ruminococcus sp.]